MRVCGPAVLEALEGGEVDEEHDQVAEADVVAVGVEPERQDALVDHHSLHNQRPQLRPHRSPRLVLVVRLRDRQARQGQQEGQDGALDAGLGEGVLAGGVVEVESAEGDAAGEEGEVVEVVGLVEARGGVHELGVTVLPLQHLVDEVEPRHAHQQEQHRESARSRLRQSLLHHRDLLVHHQRHLLPAIRGKPKISSSPAHLPGVSPALPPLCG